MIEYTDKKIAEQLQELSQKIIAGISYAEDVLKKTLQVNSVVENQIDKAEGIKLEISAIAAGTKDIENNVNHYQSAIQTIHHEVITIGSQITNNEVVKELQQEFLTISNNLRQFETQIQQIHEALPAFERQLNQGLIAGEQLVEQSQTDKKEVFELVRQLESKFNEMETILEIMDTKVSNLAIDVTADRAALASINTDVEDISITSDNSMQELRVEIEYLQQRFDQTFRELGEKLQKQAKNQQRLRNWLFGITFGVACLGFAILLVH